MNCSHVIPQIHVALATLSQLPENVGDWNTLFSMKWAITVLLKVYIQLGADNVSLVMRLVLWKKKNKEMLSF